MHGCRADSVAVGAKRAQVGGWPGSRGVWFSLVTHTLVYPDYAGYACYTRCRWLRWLRWLILLQAGHRWLRWLTLVTGLRWLMSVLAG